MGSLCTQEVDWDLKYQEVNLIVVEGKITSETIRHEVKLSWPLYEMNGILRTGKRGPVEIYGGREPYSLTEDPENPGIYRSDSLFAAQLNQYYQFCILHDRTLHRAAVTNMREVSPFQYMNVHPVQSDPPLLEASISDSDDPAILRLELDWSHLPGYDTLPDTENHAVIYHYTLNRVDVNKIFDPPQEHV